jgi:hypothetical protein
MFYAQFLQKKDFKLFWGWKNMEHITSYHRFKSAEVQIQVFPSFAKV